MKRRNSGESADFHGIPGLSKIEHRLRYNGRETAPPAPFPKEMEDACRIVEKVVGQELSKRTRYPLEWGGCSGPDKLPWRANVAASNCYEGAKESVGFHSDQLTYLGPYPTIASISLGKHMQMRYLRLL